MVADPEDIAAGEDYKCQFCGAEVTTIVNWTSGNPTFDFACGTEQLPGGFHRSDKCYKAQLAAVTAELDCVQKRLGEALGLLLKCSDPIIRNLPHVQLQIKTFLTRTGGEKGAGIFIKV